MRIKRHRVLQPGPHAAIRHRQDLSAVSSVEDGESCLQQLRDAELGVTLVAPALLALPRRVDDVVSQPAISAPILEAGSG